MVSLEFTGDGIDALDLGPTEVRNPEGTDAVTITGEALGLAVDGQVTVSPIDGESDAPVGMRWRRPSGIGSSGQDGVSFDQLTANVQAVLKEKSTTPPRVTFTATATFSDGTSREMLPRLRLSSVPYGFAVIPETEGAPQPIQRAQVWDRGHMIADVPTPRSVECQELPPIYRLSGSPWYVDADICHRFPFNARSSVRIDGTEYPCTELRINLPSGASAGAQLTELAGLDIEAAGVEALILSQVVTGLLPVHLGMPVRFSVDDGTGHLVDRLVIGWDQPWPVLEGAPTVLGPWQEIPTEGTEISIPITNDPPYQFYRLRE
jgi:hypothetical protein